MRQSPARNLKNPLHGPPNGISAIFLKFPINLRNLNGKLGETLDERRDLSLRFLFGGFFEPPFK